MKIVHKTIITLHQKQSYSLVYILVMISLVFSLIVLLSITTFFPPFSDILPHHWQHLTGSLTTTPSTISLTKVYFAIYLGEVRWRCRVGGLPRTCNLPSYSPTTWITCSMNASWIYIYIQLLLQSVCALGANWRWDGSCAHCWLRMGEFNLLRTTFVLMWFRSCSPLWL